MNADWIGSGKQIGNQARLGLGQAVFVQFANDWTLNTFTSQLEKFAQKNNGSISNCHTTCSIYSIRSGWCVISYMPHNAVCERVRALKQYYRYYIGSLSLFLNCIRVLRMRWVMSSCVCQSTSFGIQSEKNRLEMVMSSKQKWIRVADIRITVNEFVKTYNVIML